MDVAGSLPVTRSNFVLSSVENPKVVGERTEGLILAHLLTKGYSVSMPFGDNQRYDLILDDGNSLLRVQCKTGRLRNGVVKFGAHSVDGKKFARRGYRGQAELFIVYCPNNGKFYKILVKDVGVGSPYLRINPVKNGQFKNVRMAKDFEF